jgi:hypothetical protein
MGDNWRYDMWRSTKSDLEVRTTGGCIDGVHHVKLDLGEGMDPAFLVPVYMVMDALVNSFV